MSSIRKPGNCCPPSVVDSILRTKRTAEGCAWGHSLDNFFCAKAKDEDYPWTDVWTTSVLQELGVDLGSDDRGPTAREPSMRARKPWPVLKIPQSDGFPALGDVDPGSDHEDESEETLANLRRLRVLATDELAIPRIDDVDPFQVDGFPKLEESIPRQYLPTVLCVHDPDGRVSGTEPTKDTVYYKRIIPEQTPHPEENGSDSPRLGHLYLNRQSRVGSGHHSNVYRASFRPPSPLETASHSHVTVAVKVAVPRREAREFLDHEAATYGAFPEHLAHEFCGYMLVPGIKFPVPVGAVVPKFFGYYVPEHAGYDACNTAEPSPILLLEECGSPIEPQHLSHDNKAECFSMFLRLHLSGFLQQSAFKANVVVQPGPLTVSPQKRSLELPSFRIIDFGRAVRRPPKNPKGWLDEKEAEAKDVQKILRIPRHSMC
ncbi:hypothetical protein B0H17DRAFT_258578 [Mycena rosella]|uniref:Protein kinase domain-containing protein n=1 Tax=Mycena rosella TaxID=1033263 RepID=A0AAD7CWT4_MYCRO|nr:hypothetical protein B0H17DRAFT_258578 [Mycena rosella]